MRTRTLLIPLLTTLVSPLAAQEPVPVIEEGDSVAGVGTVTGLISNLAVNDAGTTLVELDTDNPDTDIDGAIVENGATVLFQEGQGLPAPAGALLDSFDAISLTGLGETAHNFFLDGTAGSSDDSGVYFGDTLVIQESDFTTDPQFTAMTPYIGFFEVKMNSSREMIIVASLDDVNIASTVDRALMRVDVDANGAMLSEVAIAKEGDVLPGVGAEQVTDFGTGPHEFAINENGDVMFAADLTGDSALNAAIYLNNALLAREGDASPVAGRVYDSLISTALDVNDSGDWVFKGSMDGDTATDGIIVLNGAKFRQEGDTLPGLNGVFTTFGSGPVILSNAGDVLWYGDWDDPDLDVDTGLFLNDELLVQEGVTTVGGVVVDTLSGISDGYTMSRNGNYILFDATLADGTTGAYLITRGLGENYCPATVNSSGMAASISASGSAVVADNDFTLESEGLPANVPGLYFFGTTEIQVPFGDGFLCVGQARRIQPAFFSTGAGTGSRVLNLANNPFAGVIVPGATIRFQHWFRDQAAGMSGFNTSNALRVLFQ